MLIAQLIMLLQMTSAELLRGGTATSNEPSSGPAKVIDYDNSVSGDCYVSSAASQNWINVMMPRKTRVRTVFISNKDSSSPISINPSSIKIGDDPDIFQNAECAAVDQPGTYHCDLVGKYVGLVQSNGLSQPICELMAYSWSSNVASYATPYNTASSSFSSGLNAAIDYFPLRLNSEYIGTCSTKGATVYDRYSRFYALNFGSSKWVNIVTIIGNQGDSGQLGLKLTFGDNEDPYINPTVNESFDLYVDQKIDGFGQYLGVIQDNYSFLELDTILVFDGCDCSALDWDTSYSSSFPIVVNHGSPQTVTINQSVSFVSTQTPSCSVSDCFPQYSLTLADDSALPSFITYSEPTLTINPDASAECKEYSLKMTHYQYQGAQYNIQEEVVSFTINVVCETTAIALNSGSAFSSPQSYTITATAVDLPVPSYDNFPATCQNQLDFQLTMADGSSLPSFISVEGTWPSNTIRLSGTDLTEQNKSYDFVLTATDSQKSLTDNSFTFTVNTVAPCPQTEYLDNPSGTSVSAHVETWTLSTTSPLVIVLQRPYEVKFTATSLVSTCSSIEYNLYKIDTTNSGQLIALPAELVTFDDSTSTATFSASDASVQGLHTFTYEAVSSSDSTLKNLDDEIIAVTVTCPTTALTLDQSSVSFNGGDYTIKSSQQLQTPPEYDYTPAFCQTNPKFTLAMADGSSLPSFISIIDLTADQQRIALADGQYSEQNKSFDFVLTATDAPSGISDSSFTFTMTTIAPCPQAEYISNPSGTSMTPQTIQYNMNDQAASVTVAQPYQVTFGETGLVSSCSTVVYTLYQTDNVDTTVRTAINTSHINFDSSTGEVSVQANDVAFQGTHYYSLVASSSSDATVENEDTKLITVEVLCTTEDMTPQTGSDVDSSITWEIQDTALSLTTPAYAYTPTGCLTDYVLTIESTDGSALPSFISLGGSLGAQTIEISGGAFSEQDLTYEFKITAEDSRDGWTDDSFTFQVITTAPCDQASSITNPSSTAMPAQTINYDLLASAETITVDLPYQVTFDATSLASSCASVVYTLYETDSSDTSVRNAINSNLITFDSSTGQVTVQSSDPSFIGTHVFSLVASSSLDSTIENEDTELITVIVTCPTTAIKPDMSSAFSSPVTWEIQDTALTLTPPTMVFTPIECQTDTVFTLSMADGSALPSFISLSGTSPAQTIKIENGALTEQDLTYNFVLTASDPRINFSDASFSFQVITTAPCDQASSITNPSNQAQTSYSLQYTMLQPSVFRSLQLPYQVTFDATGLESSCATVEYTLYETDQSNTATRNAFSASLIDFNDSSGRVTIESSTASDEGTHYYSLVASSSIDATVEHEDTLVLTLQVDCPAFVVDPNSLPATDSYEFEIQGDAQTIIPPRLSFAIAGCAQAETYSLTQANGESLPSFISITGTSPNEVITIQNGQLTEQELEYDFVLTIVDSRSGFDSPTLNFRVTTKAPCDQAQSVVNFAFSEPKISSASYQVGLDPLTFTYKQPFEVVFDATELISVCATVDYTLYLIQEDQRVLLDQSFIQLVGNVITVYTQDNSLAGNYIFSIVASSSLDATVEALNPITFDLEVLPRPESGISTNKKPYLDTTDVDPKGEYSRFSASVQLNCGDPWNFKIQPKDDDEEDTATIKEVVVGSALAFVEYDESSQILRIREGVIQPQHNGHYWLRVDLLDSKEDTSQYSISIQVNCMPEVIVPEEQPKKIVSVPEVAIEAAPKPAIISITHFGLVKLGFSTQMTPPEDIESIVDQTVWIDGVEYPALEIKLVIDENDDLQEQLEIKSKGRSKRLLQQVSEDRLEGLSFSWEIKTFTAQEMDIQLLFDEPESISTNMLWDNLEITFRDPDLFQSASGVPIDIGSAVSKQVPAQLKPEAADSFSLVSTITVGVVSTILLICVVLNLIMGESVWQTIQMVKKVQIVVTIVLINIPLPAKVQLVINRIFQVVLLDFVPHKWQDKIFTWDHTEPPSASLEMVGYTSLYAIRNLGYIFWFILAAGLLGLVVVVVSACKPDNQTLIKIKKFLFPTGFVILTEVYQVVFLTVFMLNTKLGQLSVDRAEPAQWAIGTFFSNVSAFLIGEVVIMTQVAVTWYLTANFEKIEQKDEDFESSWSPLYNHLNSKVEGKGVFRYRLVELSRVIVLCAVIVYLPNHANLQLFFIQFLPVMGIISAGWMRPFKFKQMQWLELMNETFILIQTYCLTCLSDFIQVYSYRTRVGDFLFFIIVFQIMLNTGFIVAETLSHIYWRWSIRHPKQVDESENERNEAIQAKIRSNRLARRIRADAVRQRALSQIVEASDDEDEVGPSNNQSNRNLIPLTAAPSFKKNLTNGAVLVNNLNDSQELDAQKVHDQVIGSVLDKHGDVDQDKQPYYLPADDSPLNEYLRDKIDNFEQSLRGFEAMKPSHSFQGTDKKMLDNGEDNFNTIEPVAEREDGQHNFHHFIKEQEVIRSSIDKLSDSVSRLNGKDSKTSKKSKTIKLKSKAESTHTVVRPIPKDHPLAMMKTFRQRQENAQDRNSQQSSISYSKDGKDKMLRKSKSKINGGNLSEQSKQSASYGSSSVKPGKSPFQYPTGSPPPERSDKIREPAARKGRSSKVNRSPTLERSPGARSPPIRKSPTNVDWSKTKKVSHPRKWD